MRGKTAPQATMLTAVTPDVLVPRHHPIRRIKPMVERALAQRSATFNRIYAANEERFRFRERSMRGRQIRLWPGDDESIQRLHRD